MTDTPTTSEWVCPQCKEVLQKHATGHHCCPDTEGHDGECGFGGETGGVPTATDEQIAFVQIWLITGDTKLETEAKRYLPALLVRIEQEQNANEQLQAQLDVTVPHVGKQQVTIEQLTIERDAALAINDANRDGVQLANATLDAGGGAYRELEATIERLTGALAAERAYVRAKRSGQAPHDEHWKSEWQERTRLDVNKWRKTVPLDSDKWEEPPQPRDATWGPE